MRWVGRKGRLERIGNEFNIPHPFPIHSAGSEVGIGDNDLTVAKVVMTLSVPGPAESLLRERCELEILGEILAPERYRESVGGAYALLPQLRDRIDEAARTLPDPVCGWFPTMP